MAEQIAAVVVADGSRRSHALNRYVSTEKAGQAKGERFVAASGINGSIPELAEKQMRDNRKRWGKNGTTTVEGPTGKTTVGQYVQAYHVIQSFARDGLGALDPDDPNDWEKAHELGVQLARKVAGKERLATVHTQIDGKTGCVHNHIVIDSIDRTTGRSFDSSNVKHTVLVERHDRLLADNGFVQVNEYPQEGTTKSAEKVEKSELRGLARYQHWEAGDRKEAEPFSVAVLKSRIRNALAEETFTTFDEFVDVADDHDVEVEQRGESGRGITFAMLRLERWEKDDYLPVSKSDRRRASKLGRDFMMDAVEAAIQRNIDLAKQKQADSTAPTPQKPQAMASTKHKGKVPSEAEPRQPVRKVSGPLDISSFVDATVRDQAAEAAEALLKDIRGSSDHALPKQPKETTHGTQETTETTEATNKISTASAPVAALESEDIDNAITPPKKVDDRAEVSEAVELTEAEPEHRIEKQRARTGPRKKPQWLLDIIEQESAAEPERPEGPSIG